MRIGIIGLAASAWVAAIMGLVFLGWDSSLPNWRLAAGATLALLASVETVVVLWQRRTYVATAALGASLATAAAFPAPVGSIWEMAILLVCFGAILAGYHVLLLGIHTHAAAGPVLGHGALRIATTALVAACLALAALGGARFFLDATSKRWSVSLDSTSLHLLVILGILLLAMFTGISLVTLSRTYPRSAQGSTVDAPHDSR